MKVRPTDEMVSKPISLRQRMYAVIKRAIITCELAPGEPISESDLAEQYQVSKTPVREALTSLQQDNLVEYRPNRGFMVSNISYTDIQEIYDVRVLYETALVRLAMKYITEPEIQKLEALNEIVFDWNDPPSIERYLQANPDFHLNIARASRNSRLTRHYQAILDESQRLMYMDLKQSNIVHTWHNSHQRIIEALRDGDEEAGIQAVEEIMKNQKKRIFGTE